MGVREGRDAPMAVDLLTDQVFAAWNTNKDCVGSILGLDMAGAFDHVPGALLVHKLRNAGFPPSLAGWTQSFLSERTADILIQDSVRDCPMPRRGLPQGSPASPILFILYTADLVRMCNEMDPAATCIAFSDDLTLLAVGRTTAETTATLARLNQACLQWARNWGMKFAPEKYELIHL